MASSMKNTVMFVVAMLALASFSADFAAATSTKDCSPPPGGRKSGAGGVPATKPGSGTGGATGGATRTCPVSIVRLNVCSPLLGGAPAPNCCPLLGLLGVDLELCLCLAVDLNVLNLVNVNIPKLDIVGRVATSCGINLPPNFTCPP